MKRFPAAFFLAVFLSFEGNAFALDPLPGSWPWPDALVKINQLAAGVGASCRLWVEKYGTNAYRAWKRCSVNTTASGATLRDITFPLSTGPVSATQFACGGIQCMEYSVNGSGLLVTSLRTAQNSDGSFAANQQLISPGILASDGRFGPYVVNDFSLTCIGSVIAGGAVNLTQSSQGLVYARQGRYLRETAASSNTVSAACRAGDALAYDFGEVAQTCTASVTVTAVVQGHTTEVGSCACIPSGKGVDEVLTGGNCGFIKITGDPGAINTTTAEVGTGAATTKPGSTFTNDDLARLSGSIPTVGSGSSTGMADGYGGTGTSTSGTPTGGTGGTVGPGGGSGSGSGSGNCPVGVVNCNADGSPDAGTVPGASTFDTAITLPTAGDWVGSITSFLSGSPIVGALNSSAVTASGSCSLSGSALSTSFTFNFCPWATVLGGAAPMLLILAHLAAFYIIWKG